MREHAPMPSDAERNSNIAAAAEARDAQRAAANRFLEELHKARSDRHDGGNPDAAAGDHELINGSPEDNETDTPPRLSRTRRIVGRIATMAAQAGSRLYEATSFINLDLTEDYDNAPEPRGRHAAEAGPSPRGRHVAEKGHGFGTDDGEVDVRLRGRHVADSPTFSEVPLRRRGRHVAEGPSLNDRIQTVADIVAPHVNKAIDRAGLAAAEASASTLNHIDSRRAAAHEEAAASVGRREARADRRAKKAEAKADAHTERADALSSQRDALAEAAAHSRNIAHDARMNIIDNKTHARDGKNILVRGYRRVHHSAENISLARTARQNEKLNTRLGKQINRVDGRIDTARDKAERRGLTAARHRVNRGRFEARGERYTATAEAARSRISRREQLRDHAETARRVNRLREAPRREATVTRLRRGRYAATGQEHTAA